MCGVGICDAPTREGTKPQFKSYHVWRSMLARCYSEVSLSRDPTYRGCTVCGAWLRYSVFRAWHDKNYREGQCLDKDILVPGNKVYSPSTCAYVPQELNKMLTMRGRFRGPYPCGVVCQFIHNKNGTTTPVYKALLSVSGVRKTIAAFNNPEDAGACYRAAKSKLVIATARALYKERKVSRTLLRALTNNVGKHLELADAKARKKSTKVKV